MKSAFVNRGLCLCPHLPLLPPPTCLQFENTINKAMQDLGTVMSGLNLLHTLEVKHQLQLLLSEAHVSQVRLDQQLHLAHEQDLQQLRGQLEQLLGGQAELSQQLAAATEQQRQEWVTVAGNLQQLVVEMGVIRNEVKELADAVRAWMDGCGNGQASSSSSSGLVRSRLMLGREQVQWDANAPVAQGGFANVYYGTFDGHPVAVKLLRLSAFDAEEQREQVRRVWASYMLKAQGICGCQVDYVHTYSYELRGCCCLACLALEVC